jgi:hypothetical protein
MILLLFVDGALSSSISRDERAFMNWMREYNLLYTGAEFHRRYGIWLSNLAHVRAHNARSSFTLTLNRFAATAPSEYRSLLTYRPPVKHLLSERHPVVGAIPKFLNWTQTLADQNVTFPVRDQTASDCTSDWAFAAVEAVQYAWAVSQATIPRASLAPSALNLSAAFLLHCADASYGCYGCYGGSLSGAYRWVINKHDGHFFNETAWPYDLTNPEKPPSVCPSGPSSDASRVRISDSWEIFPYSEEDLSVQCRALGAVAAGIDASRWSFALYREGIYEEPECSPYNVNHAVTVVGFGHEPKPYWIVKNSFGQGWGEGGYMRLLWFKNHCGIATVAVAPIC